MKRLHVGQQVEVISGSYKGTKSKILKLLVKEQKVLLKDIQIKKRGKTFSTRDFYLPIHESNVRVLKNETKSPKISESEKSPETIEKS